MIKMFSASLYSSPSLPLFLFHPLFFPPPPLSLSLSLSPPLSPFAFNPLQNPSLHLGWRTCAIIPELDKEIRRSNSAEYKNALVSLLAVESLLKEHQNQCDPRLIAVTEEWRKERAEKR